MHRAQVRVYCVDRTRVTWEQSQQKCFWNNTALPLITCREAMLHCILHFAFQFNTVLFCSQRIHCPCEALRSPVEYASGAVCICPAWSHTHTVKKKLDHHYNSDLFPRLIHRRRYSSVIYFLRFVRTKTRKYFHRDSMTITKTSCHLSSSRLPANRDNRCSSAHCS